MRPDSKIKGCTLQCCAILLMAFVSALPAHATFPGKNGRIAFVEGPDIFTMNPDGSDVRQLTASTGGDLATWPNWSPDGKQLVFSHAPAPDFFGQLWLMNADGSNQRLLLNDPGFDLEAPGFSADGRQIVFTRCQPFHNEFPCAIYRIQSDGTGLTQMTPFRIELEDFEPAYSPDGNTLAIESFGRGGILGALYLGNPDGSAIHRLTPAILGAYRPDWSPDGQTLAFATHCCNPDLASIFSIRRDGRRVRRITSDGGTFNDFGASWSPQGDALAFWRVNVFDGSSGIWIISADGSHAKLIRKIAAPSPRPQRLKPRRLQLHPGAPPIPTQIEEGGTLPRWGVAQ